MSDLPLTGLIGKLTEAPPLLFEKFTDLDLAPDAEPWASIRTYYKAPSAGYKAIGIIMNGVVTNKKSSFLMSKKIFNQWLAQHNGKYGLDVSGKTYARIVAQINDPDLGFVKKLTDASDYKSNQFRAASYEVIYPPLLQYLEQSKCPGTCPG